MHLPRINAKPGRMLECSPTATQSSSTLPTAFAPAERASRARLETTLTALSGRPGLKALLDAMGVSVLVLNQHRQIIIGNSSLLAALDIDGTKEALGLRPGEALGCIHARSSAGGCGTAPECATCGAAQAVLEAQRSGVAAERECLMTIRRHGHLEACELQVKASPLDIEGERFTIVGLRDVSAEKRRDALERIFLHDISNTLGALLLRAEVLTTHVPNELSEAAKHVKFLAQRMGREIEDQRVLLQAERGTLQPQRAPAQAKAVLQMAADILEHHPVTRDKTLQIEDRTVSDPVVTDESILVRVLVNMMKNALEATPRKGVVKAWAERVTGACEFRVWNARVIDAKVAAQIFKRSFSTKPGRGRGLGTFSMRLLGERYLGGAVGFATNEAEGTTFFIRLPA